MDVHELADEAETRTGSTYRAAPGMIQIEGFAQVDLDALHFHAKVRHCMLIAMADAGHIPPSLQENEWDEGADWVAWPPGELLNRGSADMYHDYWDCLERATNMVAERIGWPGDSIGERS